MRIESTNFAGLYIIHSFNQMDERGSFVKYFNQSEFNSNGLNFMLREAYYSVSKKGVLRGMHFQIPPSAHKKIVFVSAGVVNDVVLDIREKSSTFRQFFKIKLDAQNKLALFIPEGFAHGFEALENDTTMNYLQSSEYSKQHDSGILWNSFSHQWETTNPIISVRDLNFPDFETYRSNRLHFK